MLTFYLHVFLQSYTSFSPPSDGFSVTSVSGCEQQGHDPVEEFPALPTSIHPDQCPCMTVLLWSFSALLF